MRLGEAAGGIAEEGEPLEEKGLAGGKFGDAGLDDFRYEARMIFATNKIGVAHDGFLEGDRGLNASD